MSSKRTYESWESGIGSMGRQSEWYEQALDEMVELMGNQFNLGMDMRRYMADAIIKDSNEPEVLNIIIEYRRKRNIDKLIDKFLK